MIIVKLIFVISFCLPISLMAETAYELLGVKEDATDREIKNAYRRAAMKYHPDRNNGDKAAEAMFKKINDAYEAIKTRDKRASYDPSSTTSSDSTSNPKPKSDAEIIRENKEHMKAFAQGPVESGGFGLSEKEANEFVEKLGGRNSGVEKFKAIIEALPLFKKAVGEGGLGMSHITAFKKVTEMLDGRSASNLENYTKKMKLLIPYATKAKTRGGLGLAGAEAVEMANEMAQGHGFNDLERYIKKIEVAFDYLTSPIKQGGMDMDLLEAREKALNYADNWGLSDLERHVSKLKDSYLFAVKPIYEGGLGLDHADARTTSQDFAKNYSKSDLENYIKKYEMSVAFSLKPKEKGGQGLNLEEAKKSASYQASQNSLSSIKSNLSIYDMSFDFAKKPIDQGGLGYTTEQAVELAENFTKNHSLSYAKSYINIYEKIIALALQPVKDGGLGLIKDEAIEFAKNFARNHSISYTDDYIDIYRRSVAFASKNIKEGGLNLAPDEVAEYATKNAKNWSASHTKNYIYIYDLASKLALRPMTEGGFGLNEKEAKELALDFARNKSVNSMETYSTNARMSIEFATRDISKGGLGLSGEEARNTAKELSRNYSTSGLESRLEKYSTKFQELTSAHDNWKGFRPETATKLLQDVGVDISLKRLEDLDRNALAFFVDNDVEINKAYQFATRLKNRDDGADILKLMRKTADSLRVGGELSPQKLDKVLDLWSSGNIEKFNLYLEKINGFDKTGKLNLDQKISLVDTFIRERNLKIDNLDELLNFNEKFLNLKGDELLSFLSDHMATAKIDRKIAMLERTYNKFSSELPTDKIIKKMKSPINKCFDSFMHALRM